MTDTNVVSLSPIILLIEDNPGDADLALEALTSKVYVVEDGEEALHFLNKTGHFNGVPTPDLILLDLNLPKKTGRELLEIIKQREHLATIPMVILTSSKAPKDVKDAYLLHANAYIVKPIDMKELHHTMQAIEHFWLRIATLAKH